MKIATLRTERKELRGKISIILKNLKKKNLIEHALYCAEVYKMLLSKTGEPYKYSVKMFPAFLFLYLLSAMLTSNFISFLKVFIERVHKGIGEENDLKSPSHHIAAVVKSVNQKLSQNRENVKNAEIPPSNSSTENEIVKRGTLKVLVRLLEDEHKMSFENVLSLLKRAIGKSAYEHLRFMLAKPKPFKVTFCREVQIPLRRKIKSIHG